MQNLNESTGIFVLQTLELSQVYLEGNCTFKSPFTLSVISCERKQGPSSGPLFPKTWTRDWQKEVPPEVGWPTQGHVMLTVKWDYQGVSADSLTVAYGDLIQNPDPQN